ncbi:hypothetical protein [Cupriavidus sp. YAF13]
MRASSTRTCCASGHLVDFVPKFGGPAKTLNYPAELRRFYREDRSMAKL